MLEAINLYKTYELGGQTVYALDDVSLTVNDGEMLAIRGPSGSGKSTLMNILGCLDRPDSGQYILAGEDVSEMSPDEQSAVRNRRIGFVFQSFNLLPILTAEEKLNEYIMTSLRTIEGMDLKMIEEKFSIAERTRIEKILQTKIKKENFIQKNHRIILTDEGKLFADSIAVELFD